MGFERVQRGRPMHHGRARFFHAGAALAAGALLSCSPSVFAQDSTIAQSQVRAAPNSFFIAAFDVLGAKSLDQTVIEQVVYDHLGPDRTTADVEAARKALQDAYAVRGFESVQVDVLPQPEEQFAQGIIAIQVTEAPVGSVTVAGAKHHSLELVRKLDPERRLVGAHPQPAGAGRAQDAAGPAAKAVRRPRRRRPHALGQALAQGWRQAAARAHLKPDTPAVPVEIGHAMPSPAPHAQRC